jgi:flagellin-like hook-associated protein FlgL
MADVVLSGAIRSNLLSIQNTANLLDQTQKRLSTGLKVASAVDNPQSYFTALGLNNRASDLNTLLDNQGLAVQTINAASQGIDSIQKLVQQAKATANQALQVNIQATTLTTPVTTKNLSGAAATLIIQIGSASAKTVTLSSATESAGAIKLAISAAGITGLSVTATSGNLSFSAANGRKLTLSGTATGSGNSLAGAVTSTNGVNRDKLVSDYNGLLTQIDQLAQDASFNGVNLLQSGGTLTVNFNETQTSSLTIKGVDSSSTGLGMNAVTTTDFESDTSIKGSMAAADAALTNLRTLSTSFGANLSVVQTRQDFTKNLVNTLQTGASNLTLADTNEEGANMLALQTRQQLGTVALSLANQSQQGILKLFG